MTQYESADPADPIQKKLADFKAAYLKQGGQNVEVLQKIQKLEKLQNKNRASQQFDYMQDMADQSAYAYRSAPQRYQASAHVAP